MYSFSAITDVEMHHNPNEGRVIINENFRQMISGVTESVNSITGNTGTTSTYKVYSALLTQTGITAPTATVLENTLTGTPVWAYDSVGNYSATLNGAFVTNKTAVIIGKNTALSSVFITPADIIADVWYTGEDQIYVNSVNGTTAIDGVLNKLFIEIRVYN